LLSEKNVVLSEACDGKKNDEVDRIERERNMVEQPSSTISYRNQKVFIITTTTKKYNSVFFIFSSNYRFPEQILGTENGTNFFRFWEPESQDSKALQHGQEVTIKVYFILQSIRII
jgi:hypothetical protein